MGRAVLIAEFIRKITFGNIVIGEEKIQLLYYRIRFFFNKQVGNKSGLMRLSKALRLTGKAIEIGVLEGDSSEFILINSSFSILYSVDPWLEFESEYIDVNNVSQKKQDKRFHMTTERLKKYGARSVILRMTSQEAANNFDADTFDFVYIDANHSYEECKKDLNSWWQRLKKGGILCGHDYLDGNLKMGIFGVKRAVDEFVKEHRQKLFVTKEAWPTWYSIKK
ncbi:MAG: class I SAM-dependent methyltransferase [Candidatus Omnitrophica bacterium]|nr:class I SAM-dependent methyltransferase [Candidatus Omnitrophota bacterium]